MTIAQTFEYHKPATLDGALDLLGRYGPKGFLLAGGTDLVGWMRDDAVSPDAVIDLKGIPGLDDIAIKDGALHIGALVTFNQLLDSPEASRHAPLFGEMCQVVASHGVRNRATLVGNICSAVPCCDTGPVLLVYGASIHLRSSAGERVVAAQDWFQGNKRTSRQPGEIATHLVVPLPRERHAGCFVKLRRYKGEDLAQASLAVVAVERPRPGSAGADRADSTEHELGGAEGYQWRIAFGSVAPTPVRAREVEEMLNGKPLDAALLERAIKHIPEETAPITDVRATRRYRAHMLGVMLERGLQAAAARLAGTGPAYGVEVL